MILRKFRICCMQYFAKFSAIFMDGFYLDTLIIIQSLNFSNMKQEVKLFKK